MWAKAWLRPKSVVCWRDAAEHFPYACVYTQVIEFFKRDIMKTSFSAFIFFIARKCQASRYGAEKTNVEYEEKKSLFAINSKSNTCQSMFFLMLKLKLKHNATLTDI